MGVVWFCRWSCGPGFWVWVEDVHEEVSVLEANHGGVEWLFYVRLVVLLVWVWGLGSRTDRVLYFSFRLCDKLGVEVVCWVEDARWVNLEAEVEARKDCD